MPQHTSYLSLGEAFYQPSQPEQFSSPELLLLNEERANSFGLHVDSAENKSELAQLLSGQNLGQEWSPAALAYSGHQFGHFNPSLGDGRAHYLGELQDTLGHRYELQLKGSGRTPFSRGGDGLCALGPAVREFIMSAAMKGLGVPTTESLSVVTTGNKVFRDSIEEGAVVSRIAASHIRVGTFQYFASRGDTASLAKLANYAFEQHFSELYQDSRDEVSATRFSTFLNAVLERQITLVCEWMRVGFIHGVMNTDNTLISGDTIDFGPCAMLGAYDPSTVYSSIDRRGRYAFNKQADIALWNLTRLAECLLPLMDTETPEQAAELLSAVLKRYPEQYAEKYEAMMRKKMGFTQNSKQANALATEWLSLLQKHNLDYTQSFNLLTTLATQAECANIPELLSAFIRDWKQVLTEQSSDLETAHRIMQSSNPYIIPRNHLVERAIRECTENQDTSYAKLLVEALARPYDRNDANAQFDELPSDGDRNYVTYCGT